MAPSAWSRLPGGLLHRSLAPSLDRIHEIRRRLSAWRRIRFTRSGLIFTFGSFAVGFAAFNTGNNLLYLLFGAMLGLIVVSGWLSEQVIRDLSIQRTVPRGVTVGNPLRIHYQVENRRRRIPSFALEIGEKGLPGRAFLPLLPPEACRGTRSENRFIRRGIFRLDAVQISTTFPFGLFRKSRDISLPGELVIWPRSDRRLPSPRPRGGRAPRSGSLVAGSAGIRGEYRGLRTYRPGDDPRDIHWRTTARLGHPVVREYEQGDAETLWLCLDNRGPAGDRAEDAVEIVASLAAQAFRAGRRFGFVSSHQTIEAGLGPGQLERVLGALARVNFEEQATTLRPPVDPRRCVMVSLRPGAYAQYGDFYFPRESPSAPPAEVPPK